MQQRVSFITLGVQDLARSRRFYEGGMGWAPSQKGSTDGVVFFKLTNGMVFALYPRESLIQDAAVTDDGPLGFGGMSLAYNVSRKEEVAQVLKEAEQAGARILKPPHDVFWGGHVGYFTDPDGYLWEVAWNPHFVLQPDGSINLPD